MGDRRFQTLCIFIREPVITVNGELIYRHCTTSYETAKGLLPLEPSTDPVPSVPDDQPCYTSGDGGGSCGTHSLGLLPLSDLDLKNMALKGLAGLKVSVTATNPPFVLSSRRQTTVCSNSMLRPARFFGVSSMTVSASLNGLAQLRRLRDFLMRTFFKF